MSKLDNKQDKLHKQKLMLGLLELRLKFPNTVDEQIDAIHKQIAEKAQTVVALDKLEKDGTKTKKFIEFYESNMYDSDVQILHKSFNWTESTDPQVQEAFTRLWKRINK